MRKNSGLAPVHYAVPRKETEWQDQTEIKFKVYII